jgi:hypothetical protein
LSLCYDSFSKLDRSKNTMPFNGPSSYLETIDEFLGHMPHVNTGTLTFNTSQGLPGSGSQQAYKVYVRLTTGNERGSNAVTVVRP